MTKLEALKEHRPPWPRQIITPILRTFSSHVFTATIHIQDMHLLVLITLYKLGNLPVERVKDGVCFLQWCGVSLVSSYAVCFLQRGGVSLASYAIIYNIMKVKVTR